MGEGGEWEPRGAVGAERVAGSEGIGEVFGAGGSERWRGGGVDSDLGGVGGGVGRKQARGGGEQAPGEPVGAEGSGEA